jgi:hypothetical protein
MRDKSYDEIMEVSVVNGSFMLFRRKCLDEIGFFDENIKCWEGYDLWLRVAYSYQIGFINAPLLLRRLHGNNLFYSSKLNEIFSLIKIIEKWEEKALALPKVDRATIKHKLGREYCRLGIYYLSQCDPNKAHLALKKSLDHRFSLRNIIYLGLSMLPAPVLQYIRKGKHRLGFLTTKPNRI